MVPSTAKIVIIGAGVLGTSAAFRLAAAGHQDIVLLDRGPIADGTTPFHGTTYRKLRRGLSTSADRRMHTMR